MDEEKLNTLLTLLEELYDEEEVSTRVMDIIRNSIAHVEYRLGKFSSYEKYRRDIGETL